jgi:small subunit ribosomal protein S19
MPRSLKKGPYCDEKLIKKVQKNKESGSTDAIETRSRASTILPDFVGAKFKIHNGKAYVEIFVTEEMVGHKLGEFARTTIFKGHGGKKAK